MNKLKLIGMFVGPLRIVNLHEIERKTYLGRDIVEVELGDKSKKEYPVEDLETIATEEAIDLSALRLLEIHPIATKILGILADSELPLFDPAGANIQYLLQSVLPDSIQESKNAAYGKLLNKKYCEITLSDIDRVFNKDVKPRKTKENPDGPSSK